MLTNADFDSAVEHFRTGDLKAARDCCNKIIESTPEHAGAHHLLGVIMTKRLRFADGLRHLKTAATLDPNDTKLLFNLAVCYAESGDDEQAAREYERLLSIDPNNLPALANLGILFQRQRARDKTVEIYERIVEIRANDISALQMLARSYREARDLNSAIDTNRRILSINSNNAAAHRRLVSLLEENNQLDQARQEAEQLLRSSPDDLLAKIIISKCIRRRGDAQAAYQYLSSTVNENGSLGDRRDAYFELCRAADAAGLYKDSLDAAVTANHLSARLNVDRANIGRVLIQNCELLQQHYSQHATGPALIGDDLDDTRQDPVFVVGFPRSGTSLLGQALNRHSRIVVTQEEPFLNTLTKTIKELGGAYPQSLSDFSEEQVQQLRSHYFSQLEGKYAVGERQIIVDKNPFNFLNLDLVLRLFPRSRVIFIKRQPRDIAISCFFQNFRHNEATANFYDIESIANLYDAAMKVWFQYRPEEIENVTTVGYENIVANFRDSIERLLTEVGLDWEGAVEEFYRQDPIEKRRVLTASYDQVTEGLHDQSINRWRHYADAIRPVDQVLGVWETRLGF